MSTAGTPHWTATRTTSIREPELFSKLILIGPSPRYIDDAGYRGGFSPADVDDLLGSLDSNYLG